jgi:UDP-N-acetylmuramate dehydrogenase
LPSGDPEARVALAPFTTLRVGGEARWFARAGTADDIAAAHGWSQQRGVPLFVLGGGSNLVVADEGVDALVLQVGLGGVAFVADGADVLVTAGAGEPWDPLVASTVERRLAGLEGLSGIPGCVGGTPIQNVGAYGQEVAETIERVTVYDRTDAGMTILTGSDCRFDYRVSRFKREDAGRFVVCGVTFRLHEAAPAPAYPDIISYLERAGVVSPTVADVRDAVLAVRRRKGMVIDEGDPDTRSVGSFFMNPIVPAAACERVASAAGVDPPVFELPGGRVKISAAWLIERTGFRRGHAEGPAGISGKHTLALVNRGGATARDVLRLAVRIKRAVADGFGVWLRPEPVFVGFGRDPDVEYLQSHP